MAYRINYTPEDSRKYPQTYQKHKPMLGRYCIFLVILVGVLYWKHYGVPDFLIPGDKDITVHAAKVMVAGLKAGEPLEDVVTAFCQEIIHSAE